MTAALLLALLALQDRPVILDVRTLTDGYARSGCWLPLKVRIGGPAGFEGEVVASADAGFRVARSVRIPPSGTCEVILPVVMLAREAKPEIVLRGPSGETVSWTLKESPAFLNRELLVLLDPGHPDTDALRAQDLKTPDGRPLRFGVSDPTHWNEAADLGAFEIVDAVVVSESRAAELDLAVWRALGGGVVREPRRELDQNRDPSARFPAIDPAAARFTSDGTWIPHKRDTTQLFVVIYAFSFFVVVFATWTRKGGPWLLMSSAVVVAALFVAAFSAFYPKGNLAVKYWQGIVDAPEEKVSISISALWGSGPAGDVRFGRIVKPVHATVSDAGRRELELRRTDEGRWIVRGARPGDPTRFVSVDRLRSLDPYRPAGNYNPAESQYYLRVGRKDIIRLQDPKTSPLLQIDAEGLIDVTPARVFRVGVGGAR